MIVGVAILLFFLQKYWVFSSVRGAGSARFTSPRASLARGASRRAGEGR